jgi:hypothetical protein
LVFSYLGNYNISEMLKLNIKKNKKSPFGVLYTPKLDIYIPPLPVEGAVRRPKW